MRLYHEVVLWGSRPHHQVTGPGQCRAESSTARAKLLGLDLWSGPVWCTDLALTVPNFLVWMYGPGRLFLFGCPLILGIEVILPITSLFSLKTAIEVDHVSPPFPLLRNSCQPRITLRDNIFTRQCGVIDFWTACLSLLSPPLFPGSCSQAL